jgi:hypothetical protein
VKRLTRRPAPAARRNLKNAIETLKGSAAVAAELRSLLGCE